MTPKKNTKTISASVDLEVATYLDYVKACGMKRSLEVNKALRRSPGFKKFIKEQNEET